jgi:diphthamide synthase subunit DPH2
MDACTFGDFDAAKRLAEILEEEEDPKLRKKVGSMLHAYNARVAELVCSNLPLRTKRWALGHAFTELEKRASKLQPLKVRTFTLNVAKSHRRVALVNITRYRFNDY